MMTIWSGDKAPEHVFNTLVEHQRPDSVTRENLLWVFFLVCAEWDKKTLTEGQDLLQALRPQNPYWIGVIDFRHDGTMTRIHYIRNAT